MKHVTKREKDCVSKLSLAAAMLNPNYVYGTAEEPALRWDAPGGLAAFRDYVIEGYYHSEYMCCMPDCAPGVERLLSEDERLGKIDRAISQLTSWRNGSIGGLTTASAKRAGQTSDAAGFFSRFEDLLPDLAPVAIMLCSQLCGQGPSERAHKVTGRTLTKVYTLTPKYRSF
jgi:hypothetical protein